MTDTPTQSANGEKVSPTNLQWLLDQEVGRIAKDYNPMTVAMIESALRELQQFRLTALSLASEKENTK